MQALKPMDPRTAQFIAPRLRRHYSPSSLATVLVYGAICMGDRYAILSENALLDEDDSTAVISGPTATLERIRTAEAEIDVRYLVYKRRS